MSADNTKIVFQDGVATVVQENVLYKCKMEEMLAEMQADLPIKTDFMPRGLVYYERSAQKRSVMIIESPPRLMRLKYQARKAGQENVDIFRLSVPFVYFSLFINEESKTIAQVWPFCSKEAIRNDTDTVYVLPLPNINGSGHNHFCLGSNAYEMGWPLHKKADFVVTGIFATTWNDDLPMTPLKTFGVSSFKEWSDISMKNPLFWTELKMVEHQHKTARGIISVWLQQ